MSDLKRRIAKLEAPLQSPKLMTIFINLEDGELIGWQLGHREYLRQHGETENDLRARAAQEASSDLPRTVSKAWTILYFQPIVRARQEALDSAADRGLAQRTHWPMPES